MIGALKMSEKQLENWRNLYSLIATRARYWTAHIHGRLTRGNE